MTNHDNSSALNYYPTFNPIDKLMEALEEKKKLYERLLQSEKDKVEILQKLIPEKSVKKITRNHKE